MIRPFFGGSMRSDASSIIGGFQGKQRRWIQVWLGFSAAVLAWLLWALPAPPPLQAFRITLLGMFLAALPWLRARPGDQARVTGILMVATAAGIFLRASAA